MRKHKPTPVIPFDKHYTEIDWTSVKDSGARQSFPTGSVRDTREGKGRYDLIPHEPLRRLAVHFENGAKKYGDRNWEKGQPLSRYFDSATRHALKWFAGETDEDHAAAWAWNVFAAIATQERIARGLLPAELDDLPKGGWGGQEEARRDSGPEGSARGGDRDQPASAV